MPVGAPVAPNCLCTCSYSLAAHVCPPCALPARVRAMHPTRLREAPSLSSHASCCCTRPELQRHGYLSAQLPRPPPPRLQTFLPSRWSGTMRTTCIPRPLPCAKLIQTSKSSYLLAAGEEHSVPYTACNIDWQSCACILLLGSGRACRLCTAPHSMHVCSHADSAAGGGSGDRAAAATPCPPLLQQGGCCCWLASSLQLCRLNLVRRSAARSLPVSPPFAHPSSLTLPYLQDNERPRPLPEPVC